MGSLEKLCCCFDSIAVAFVILCHMLTLSAGPPFTCCWPGWLDKCPLWVTSPTTSTLLTHKPLEDHTTNKLRHKTNKANHQQTQPTTSRADKHKSANSKFCLRIQDIFRHFYANFRFVYTAFGANFFGTKGLLTCLYLRFFHLCAYSR